MFSLEKFIPSLAVLVDEHGSDGFHHRATAWCIGESGEGDDVVGEWIAALPNEFEMRDTWQLITVAEGAVHKLESFEIDAGIVALKVKASATPLKITTQSDLKKRETLFSIAYPSVIDHPQFKISRHSLTAERYVPYLCPWASEAYLALFGADDGYLSGRYYNGMNGGPVLNNDEEVVGMIVDGEFNPDFPPLTRFRRLSQNT